MDIKKVADVNADDMEYIQNQGHYFLTEVLEASWNETAAKIVKKLYECVNTILSGKYTEAQIDDFSFWIAAAWGRMVVKKYHWSWKEIEFSGGSTSFYLVSPKEYFICNPFACVRNILSGNNAGLDGKNDNTVALLFNSLARIEIDGINGKKPVEKYVSIW